MPKLALLTASRGLMAGEYRTYSQPLHFVAGYDEYYEQVHDYTDGIGADWALEVVGLPGVIPDGVGFLNNGGTLLWPSDCLPCRWPEAH